VRLEHGTERPFTHPLLYRGIATAKFFAPAGGQELVFFFSLLGVERPSTDPAWLAEACFCAGGQGP